MSNDFNPYRVWLQIDSPRNPPHHYELLGLPLWESDPGVIRRAFESRYEILHRYTSGGRGEIALQVMAQLQQAYSCLSCAAERLVYNQSLLGDAAEGQPVTGELVVATAEESPAAQPETIADPGYSGAPSVAPSDGAIPEPVDEATVPLVGRKPPPFRMSGSGTLPDSGSVPSEAFVSRSRLRVPPKRFVAITMIAAVASAAFSVGAIVYGVHRQRALSNVDTAVAPNRETGTREAGAAEQRSAARSAGEKSIFAAASKATSVSTEPGGAEIASIPGGPSVAAAPQAPTPPIPAPPITPENAPGARLERVWSGALVRVWIRDQATPDEPSAHRAFLEMHEETEEADRIVMAFTDDPALVDELDAYLAEAEGNGVGDRLVVSGRSETVPTPQGSAEEFASARITRIDLANPAAARSALDDETRRVVRALRHEGQRLEADARFLSLEVIGGRSVAQLSLAGRTVWCICPPAAAVNAAQWPPQHAVRVVANSMSEPVLIQREGRMFPAILLNGLSLTARNPPSEVPAKRSPVPPNSPIVETIQTQAWMEIAIHLGQPRVHSWSHDEQYLATGGADNPFVAVTELPNGRLERVLPASSVAAMHWSAAGNQLVANQSNGAITWTFVDQVPFNSFSPAGASTIVPRQLAGRVRGNEDGTYLGIATGSTLRLTTGAADSEFATLALEGPVEEFAMSPGGEHLAVVGFRTGPWGRKRALQIFDTSRPKIPEAVWLVDTNARINGMLWRQDDFETHRIVLLLDDRVSLWKLPNPIGSQPELKPIDMPFADAKHRLQVAVRNDGHLLGMFDQEGVVVRECFTGAPVMRARTQASPVALGFSPDLAHFAVGSSNGDIQIWDLERLGLSFQDPEDRAPPGALPESPSSVRLKGKRSVWSLAWSPNSSQLATGHEDHVTRVWHPFETPTTDVRQLLADARRHFAQNEWERFYAVARQIHELPIDREARGAILEMKEQLRRMAKTNFDNAVANQRNPLARIPVLQNLIQAARMDPTGESSGDKARQLRARTIRS